MSLKISDAVRLLHKNSTKLWKLYSYNFQEDIFHKYKMSVPQRLSCCVQT